MKTIFSGIQPSGGLHIGNYIGAIQQWVKMQNEAAPEDRYIFMLADLHTITVPQKPEDLRTNTIDLTVWYVAAGLDPNKITLFAQSHNPDHPYAAWVYDCITPMGWMERMTQYKDKSKKQEENTSVGLFHYPSLMAADILLYDTDLVPVGEDQTQHVELARDVAKKFNARFGEVFKLPKALIQKHGARIMSLQDPSAKMSKSDTNQSATVMLLDDADIIQKKIARAVTDSGTDIVFREDKPAISNLLTIYSVFAGETIPDLEAKYSGSSYSEFKKDLATVLVDKIMPIHERYHELMRDQTHILSILRQGAEKARNISSAKLSDAKRAVGFLEL